MSEERSLERQITEQRLEKVASMRASGTDPYPVRWDRDALAGHLADRFEGLGAAARTGVEVSVGGRLMALRSHGSLIFGELQDHSGRIQLFVEEDAVGEDVFQAFGDLDLGDWVGSRGEVITTRRGELSVAVEEFRLLAKALRPLPEKWHGLQDVELRYRRRYLDLLTDEEARETVAIRVATVGSLRDSFRGRGFVEVETPVLQLQPGGALARPFVTHHNALDLDMYLRIATELHLKRLVVGGMERVFEIGRIFRNEGISPKYNPEFTMLEAYQAFADYTDMIELTEAVVAEAALAARGDTKVHYDGKALDLTPPWRRIRYVEAVSEAAGEIFDAAMPSEEAERLARQVGLDVEPGASTGRIIEEAFDHLVEPDLFQPTVVMDYPKEISPLARTHRDDPALAERFEVIVAGWEVANAFSELNDPLEQRERFEEQARARAAGDEEAHPIDEDYLRALEYGLPPTGGLGIGVDRLVMVLADRQTIREVILFPHLKPEA